jgi:hypothetical protein
MAGAGEYELPAGVVRFGRPYDVSGQPLFTAADLRAARRDRSDLHGFDGQKSRPLSLAAMRDSMALSESATGRPRAQGRPARILAVRAALARMK